MKISHNSRVILERRYLNRDANGNVTETVEELFERVAGAIAAVETNYDSKADVQSLKQEFYNLIYARKREF
mgnify:FL=1